MVENKVEVEKKLTQLQIDGLSYNMDTATVVGLSHSLEKRNKRIDELTNELINSQKKEKQMEKFNIGEEMKEYESMSDLYTDMAKVIDEYKKQCDMYKCDRDKMKAEILCLKKDMETANKNLNKSDAVEDYNKQLESTKLEMSNKISELEGKNASLTEELSKRMDSKEVDTRVKERVGLIHQVTTVSRLDSNELMDLTSKEIKIKALVNLNKNLDANELSKRNDAYIDGAFEVAYQCNENRRNKFDEQKMSLEHLQIQKESTETSDFRYKSDLGRAKRLELINK